MHPKPYFLPCKITFAVPLACELSSLTTTELNSGVKEWASHIRHSILPNLSDLESYISSKFALDIICTFSTKETSISVVILNCVAALRQYGYLIYN